MGALRELSMEESTRVMNLLIPTRLLVILTLRVKIVIMDFFVSYPFSYPFRSNNEQEDEGSGAERILKREHPGVRSLTHSLEERKGHQDFDCCCWTSFSICSVTIHFTKDGRCASSQSLS